MSRQYIIDGQTVTTDRPFRINGVEIPTPIGYEPSIEDLSSDQTGRVTLTGKMVKDVVAVKITYKCTWKRLSWEDTALILNAIDGKPKVTFTHADPRVPNQWITKEFYVGQRGNTALDLSEGKGFWNGLAFSFIEI